MSLLEGQQQEEENVDGPQERHYPGGQPYSGTNRIPNIKQFMEGLDRDKKERDAQLEAQVKQNQQNTQLSQNLDNGEAQAHVPTKKPGKNRRTVKDPVTGRDVEIEDIDANHMKTAKDPKVFA